MDILFQKALFITRFFPVPADDGALVYTSQLIRFVAGLSEQVEVHCQYRSMDKGGPTEAEKSIFPDNVSFIALPPGDPTITEKIFTALPHAAIRHATQENKTQLDAMLQQNPDCIILDHIGSAWAYRQIRDYRSRYPDVRIVYCTHNMEFDTRLIFAKHALRTPAIFLGALADLLRIDRAERRLIGLADNLTCITSKDRQQYVTRYDAERVEVVRPTYWGPVSPERTIDSSVPRQICIVGSFVWSAKKRNLISFLKHGYELFVARGIKVMVVGNMAAADQAAFERTWPKIDFTGPVAEVEPFIASSRLGVIPEAIGGGFKLKTIEYVFNRLPIFALSEAIVDVPLIAGSSIELFPDMASLCQGIAEQIDDLEHLNALQQNAYKACLEFGNDSEPRAMLRNTLTAT